MQLDMSNILSYICALSDCWPACLLYDSLLLCMYKGLDFSHNIGNHAGFAKPFGFTKSLCTVPSIVRSRSLGSRYFFNNFW